MKNFCKGCMWIDSKEPLEFCEVMQKSNHTSCSKFYFWEDKNKEEPICSTCKRKKDPGKCWWCGN